MYLQRDRWDGGLLYPIEVVHRALVLDIIEASWLALVDGIDLFLQRVKR
jgi:hypothetical protein